MTSVPEGQQLSGLLRIKNCITMSNISIQCSEWKVGDYGSEEVNDLWCVVMTVLLRLPFHL